MRSSSTAALSERGYNPPAADFCGVDKIVRNRRLSTDGAIEMNKFVIGRVFVFVTLTLPSTVAFAATEDLVVYSRMGERFLVTAAGVLSLVLGYKLFRVVGAAAPALRSLRRAGPDNTAGGPAASQANEQVTDVSGAGFEGSIGQFVSVKMSDAGPGLFFALFGAVLLGYVMFSHIDIDTKDAGGGDTHLAMALPPIGLENRAKIKTVVAAIRQLQNIQSGGITQNVDSERAKAIENLGNSIPDLIDFGFGAGGYATFTRLLVMTNDQRKLQPANDLNTFNAVNALLNNGV
jgi:hypothetical protein